MPALVGLVMDVSGSMKGKSGGVLDWMKSIFTTIRKLNHGDRMVQSAPYISTCTPDDHVFAIGCGGNGDEPHIFDILGTVKYLQHMGGNSTPDNLHVVLKETLDILKRNGAPYVRDWADEYRLKRLIKLKEGKAILYKLRNDRQFTSEFVQNVLPEECRKHTERTTKAAAAKTSYAWAPMLTTVLGVTTAILAPGIGWGAGALMVAAGTGTGIGGAIAANKEVGRATDASIKETIWKGMKLVRKGILHPVSLNTTLSIEKACNILRSYTSDENQTEMDDLVQHMEPAIYSCDRKIITAIWKAKELFSQSNFNTYEQILFVLSDGLPTDSHWCNPIPDFNTAEVTVVSAYISGSESRQLHSRESPNWDSGANFYFRLSSPIDTQRVSPTVFTTLGWSVESREPEPRLFCQISRPSSVEDVYTLAKDVVSAL